MKMYNSYSTNVTWPAKVDHLRAKNHRFLACLLYRSLTVYNTAIKSSSPLQNLMGFLLQLTEMG